jgi:hypothetical protein
MDWTPGQLEFDSLQVCDLSLLHLLQTGPTKSNQWLKGAITSGVKQEERELTTHVHLVPRLRTCGAISPLHHMSQARQVKRIGD